VCFPEYNGTETYTTVFIDFKPVLVVQGKDLEIEKRMNHL